MKPILRRINAIDAQKPLTLEFVWEGNQSFGNICVIRQNDTNDIVYQQSQTTMQLKHTIESNTLINGVLYNASIATIDSENNISEYSNPILFYCYSTPQFTFNNIKSNQIIRNSSYQTMMDYVQVEGEALQSYEISLFDSSKSLIRSSGVQYSTDVIKYTLSGLEDNQSYFVKATGKTLNGMDIATEYIYFSVNYIQPAIYSILTTENVKENGYIKLQSNIKSIECYTNKDPIFIDGEYINLKDDVLTMNDNFILSDNFIINFSGYNISEGLIMQLSNSYNNIYVYLRKGIYDVNNNVEKTFVELTNNVGLSKYECRSNYINNLSKTQPISVWITKKNGLFTIYLKGGE